MMIVDSKLSAAVVAVVEDEEAVEEQDSAAEFVAAVLSVDLLSVP